MLAQTTTRLLLARSADGATNRVEAEVRASVVLGHELEDGAFPCMELPAEPLPRTPILAERGAIGPPE